MSPRLLLALFLALPAQAQQTRIAINVEVPAAPVQGAAMPVAPVALPTMGLGSQATPLRFGPPATVFTAKLGEVRIRGVAIAAAPGPAGPGESFRAPTRGAAAKPLASAKPDEKPREAGAIDLAGATAQSANVLAKGIALPPGAQAPAGGELRLRETIGAAFDGADRIRRQEVDVLEGPVTAEELFGSRPGLALDQKESGRLARHADDTARLRGKRAVEGEAALAAEDAAVLRGIDDLARAVALGRTTPRELALAAKIVERMDLAKLKRFSEAAGAFIRTDVAGKSTPFARVGNVEHVEQQLIEPLAEDGEQLARAFKTNQRQSVEHFVEMLRALQFSTDLGKQQVPDDMKAALLRFNPQAETGPNWYINNFILTHEYASMQLTQELGKQAGFSATEVWAFQKLIANHNFGPDLTDPNNAAMREHWWPRNFRRNMLPMFAAMGLDVERVFSPDETGALQYNHAEGHAYTLLLSAYDRAIAVSPRPKAPGNGNGLATWKKYAIQDFNGKKGQLKGIREANKAAAADQLLKPDPQGAKDEEGRPGPIFEFDGPSVIAAMFDAAGWAEQHVESLWATLHSRLPVANELRDGSWRMFAPFYAQRKAIGALLGVLRQTSESNPVGMTNRADVVPGSGLAYYEGTGNLKAVYRVKLERGGLGAFNPRSTDYEYRARIDVQLGPGAPGADKDGWASPRGPPFEGEGALASAGPDPAALLLDLIRYDKGW